MNRQRICTLLISGLLMLTSSAFAKTLYVGTCETTIYTTISSAVAAATAGDTIDVCPGTYAEQVFITQQLTLQGITSSGGDRARIVVPTNAFGGATSWQFETDPIENTQVAPQVFVNSPAGSPVKITNLTIDATGEVGAPKCEAPGWWETIGIYAWTSVTIDEVNTIGQGQTSCGIGIQAEQGLPAIVPSITIEHSSVQNPLTFGIVLSSLGTGSPITVSVTNNSVTNMVETNAIALFVSGATGKISSNTFVTPGTAILDGSGNSSLTISSNTLISTAPSSGFTGFDAGYPGADSTTLSDNKIVGFYWGVDFSSATFGTATITNNTIVNSYAAFNLSCGETLSGNTINNATYGFYLAPIGFSTTGKASFYNVNQFIMASITCP